MLIKIHPVFFAQRMFYCIPYKQQGKMKMLLFPLFSPGIRTKKFFFNPEGNGNLRSPQMEFLIQLPVYRTNLCSQDRNFLIKNLYQLLVLLILLHDFPFSLVKCSFLFTDTFMLSLPSASL